MHCCLTLFEEKVIRPTTDASYLGVVALTYLVSLGVASVVYVVLERPAVSLGKEPCHSVYKRPAVRGAKKKPGDGTHSPDLANATISFAGLDHARTKAFVTSGC